MAAVLLAGSGAQAQPAWPSRPVRIVVPYQPGGSSDVLARLVQPHLAATLGQPVLVENRAGAGSQIGTETVVRSEADGYTLLLADTSLAVLPAVSERLGYDPQRDLVPVTQLARAPFLLAVRASLPASSMAEFAALGRARPEALSFGTGGLTGRLLAALLEDATGMRLTVVPYRGGSAIATDLAGGRLDSAPIAQASAAPLLAAGQVRLLAVMAPSRLAELPDVPTLREQGIDLVAEFWFGLLAPSRTPPAVVERLAAAGAAALRAQDVAARLAGLGIIAQADGPGDFAALVAADTARFGAIARARGIRDP